MTSRFFKGLDIIVDSVHSQNKEDSKEGLVSLLNGEGGEPLFTRQISPPSEKRGGKTNETRTSRILTVRPSEKKGTRDEHPAHWTIPPFYLPFTLWGRGLRVPGVGSSGTLSLSLDPYPMILTVMNLVPYFLWSNSHF